MESELYKQQIDLERQIIELNNQGRFEEKIELLKKGLEINPRRIYFNSNLGLYYYNKGDYELAYKYFRVCIEEGDKFTPLKNKFYNCLIILNKTPDKLEKKLLKSQYTRNKDFLDFHLILMERCLKENPVDMDILYYYIAYKRKKDEIDNIFELFDGYLDQIPNNSMGFQVVEKMTELALENKNINKAKEYADIYEQMIKESQIGNQEIRKEKLKILKKRIKNLQSTQ